MPALIFDCDGVLADTEQYGHLPAFNQTFADFHVPVQWSVEEYAEKVKIGGGKERMRSILTPSLSESLGLENDDAVDRAILSWHRRKTEVYKGLVESGVMPARPGIARIVQEAHDAGWTLAVASTSAEPAVRAVLTHAVGDDLAVHFSVFAGDVVSAKKPAPDIYLLTLKELGVEPQDAIVVEDSANGLRAAVGAGLRTVVTVSGFTRGEDFTGAELVVSSLGDPDGEQAEVLADPHGVRPSGAVTLAVLQELLDLPATTHETETP
ncbi:HAD-IA family hydrolase [Arthrobacter sp. zg-Y859]|uniref:HAD-IA family hydrolase n=1 Tax=Arthrobacter jinronghuae TaxID=2964609 RepID=A0ABT1NPM4_9MICC|nr:HAD-IA family hydrolase [Arthrobacter jinronghuae]MCQ1949690.1 HAD-IA family hydrolase [Arthrobacter jinronghuae]UWX79846.1 HAD-IA family hydrolase [Arthrobacter jinronghuae]